MKSEEAFLLLRDALRNGRLAHAYIIAGDPRGDAQTLALRLAQLLFCERPDPPCGECRCCRQVAGGQYADVHWIEPQKKSRIMGIEVIREVLARLGQTAFCGGWKLCVLSGADRLGPDGSNALLKTLEEPSRQTLFLLLTGAPQFLLPTILSRCQFLALSGEGEGLAPEWREELLDALIGGGGDPALARLRRVVRVRALLKQMNDVATAIEKESMSEVDAAAEKADDILNARASARYRGMRTDLVRALLRWYRDLLLLTCGASEERLHHAERLEALRRLSQGLTVRRALENVRGVEWINRHIEMNIPDDLVFEYVLGQLT